MVKIKMFFIRLFGCFSQNQEALHKADLCLDKCQQAWTVKVFSDCGSKTWQKSWWEEQFWSRQHSRFLNLAYRKSPYEKH